MLVHGQFPVTLPKLGIALIFAQKRELFIPNVGIRVFLPGDTDEKASIEAEAAPDVAMPTLEGDDPMISIVAQFVMSPLVISQPGLIKVQTQDSVRDFEGRIEEAAGLARAIDLTVIESIVAPVSQIRPATYLGKGSGQAGDRERLHQRAPTGSNIPIRRTTRRRDKKNGGRPRSKSTRHLPKSRS